MRLLDKREYGELEAILKLDEKNLLKVMKILLEEEGYSNIVSTKDYIVAVGDTPVALVAHLDTVFKHPPQNIFYDREKNVMWSPEGLGADDRAGVFAIVEIIRNYEDLNPTIILTTGEEKGCIGAEALVEEIPLPPTEIKYIIELDRRGYNDCVFYSCDNEEFEKYVESFGFVTDWGSFSDISSICPAWKTAGVNLSIGYYGEHDYCELLCIEHMYETIGKVVKMLKEADEAESFEYIPKAYTFPTKTELYEWNQSYEVAEENLDYFLNPSKSKCSFCGEEYFDYDLYPVFDEDKRHILYGCPDCISREKSIKWCLSCGEPYINSDSNQYCEECIEGILWEE